MVRIANATSKVETANPAVAAARLRTDAKRV
jgi:hypothetical protein